MIAELLAKVCAPGIALPPLDTRDVSEAELTAVLAAARVAPSADNLQTWRFVIVRDRQRKAMLGEAVGPLADSVAVAPVAIVVCGVRTAIARARREQPFVLVDVPIALTHLLLEAAELGLAASWTLEPDEPTCTRCVGLPPDVRPIAIVALGWPSAVEG